jgi:hypothetical protein
LIVSLVKVGIATLTWLALVGAADAQTIRYDDGGRARTYEFNPGQQGVAEGATNPRRRQRASTKRGSVDLPRGPRNIPWDEPGKISGVPGVLENSATSLPEKRAARPVRPKHNGGSSNKVLMGAAETESKPRARREPPPQLPDASAKAPSYGSGQKDIGSAARPIAPTSNAQADNAKTEDHHGEPRAQLIEKLRASAWAEEQRRLEAERSRDRRAPSSGPRPSIEGNKDTARTIRVQPDPDHTGTVTAAPQEGTAAPEQPGWMRRMCRMVFFGALPGC